jgi:hypothetical protein
MVLSTTVAIFLKFWVNPLALGNLRVVVAMIAVIVVANTVVIV